MQLSDFLNDEFIPNQERYYLILSQKHACAATIKKQENGKYEYTFFDPNQGIKYFNNKKDFDHFIYNFTKENADYYNFIKSEKGDDYSIQFLDLGKPSLPGKLIHKKISMPDTQTLPPLEGTLV
ncbi:TPA: YopT-type cysteine protease domain-containing protein [Providencia alcalifaciens]